MKAPTLFLIIGATLAGARLCAEVEFCGYMVSSTDAHFVLAQNGEQSRWLAIGQSFGDYQVVAFDRREELLTVRSPAGLRKLPLKPSRVLSGQVQTQPIVISIAGAAAIETFDTFASLELLKSEIERVAAMEPQPRVTLSARVESAAFARKVYTLCRDAGIKLVLIQAMPNKAPEPTPTSVTSPAAQEPRQP